MHAAPIEIPVALGPRREGPLEVPSLDIAVGDSELLGRVAATANTVMFGPTALAIPVEAALNYYEGRGQNWERAAMIKARPVAGDLAAGAEFLAHLKPYVWRRNLDFAAIPEEPRWVQSLTVDAEGRLYLADIDGKRLFVACADAGTVQVVDTATWRVTGEVATGREPDGMAYVRD